MSLADGPPAAQKSFAPGRLPEVPTTKLAARAPVSTVTVAPAVIVTLSASVGTTPPTHVDDALQFPPDAVETIFWVDPSSDMRSNASTGIRARVTRNDPIKINTPATIACIDLISFTCPQISYLAARSLYAPTSGKVNSYKGFLIFFNKKRTRSLT